MALNDWNICLGILVWVAVLCFVEADAAAAEDHCIWYGSCTSDNHKNCPYNGTAKVLIDQPNGAHGLQILKKNCPWLYKGDNTRTCCAYTQLVSLADGIKKLQALFGACPSCMYNYRQNLCGYTCLANQSAFMRVTETKTNNDTGVPRQAVTNVTIAFAAADLQATYTSCVEVIFNGQRSINTVCDSIKGKKYCLEKDFWYNFGHNPLSPFVLDIVSSGPKVKGLTLFSYPTIACNETAPGQLYSCPCQTCPARTDCKTQPAQHVVPDQRFTVTIDGVSFVMGCIFTAFLFFFSIWITYKSASASSLPDSYLFETSTGSSAMLCSIEKAGDKLRMHIDVMLGQWCHYCACNPGRVLFLSVAVAGMLCGGIAMFKVVTDPVKLWSAPHGEFRQQKNAFDTNFAPFYRTQQVIVTLDDGLPAMFNRLDEAPSKTTLPFCSNTKEHANYTLGQVFRLGILEKVLELQTKLADIVVLENVTLEDICFAPLKPGNNKCATETVLQYWQNNLKNLKKTNGDDFMGCIYTTYVDHLLECTLNPLQPLSSVDQLELPCLGAYGGPAIPNVVLGGYNGVAYLNSTALVLTYLINNHVNEEDNRAAEVWEAEFLKTVETFNRTVQFFSKEQCHLFPNCDKGTSMVTTDLRIAYSAQRSIPDEVSRESMSDVVVIGLSYTLMFVYVAISLGKVSFSHPAILMVDSKISLALAGVIMVLLAVAASIGTLALLGVRATLIVFEVVPFLVLAVGVDNLFLMVQALQRDIRLDNEDIPAQVGRVLASVAPSLTLSALAESVAFFCGALSDIPAVRSFSLYAGLAVLFNYCLQMTAFVALLSLDARRKVSGRMDILCCIPGVGKKGYRSLDGENQSYGVLHKVILNFYAPALLSKFVRPVVICVFAAIFCMSIVATTRLDIGLGQTTALPQDSYLVPYFGNLSRYLKVGAPVYFVVDGEYPYDESSFGSRICAAGGNCSQNSLVQQIIKASHQPEISTIAQPPMAWLDNYYQWLSPATGCCRIKPVPALAEDDEASEFCSPTDKSPNCTDCLSDGATLPTKEEFDVYLHEFLRSNPSAACPLGGHAAYNSALSFVPGSDATVKASYFMTYHTPANDSTGFINALKQAQLLADSINADINYPGVKVFPYSVFYVFYGQYLTIVRSAAINLTLATISLFAISFIMLSMRLRPALFILATVWMIIVDVMGVMYIWGIKFNAISLVNLVVAMGIAVEFCVHIVNTFNSFKTGSRLERASETLITTGSSVFSGITLTKFGGVVVLAFTKSKLFQVYYFRMYMAIVSVGAAHGLIFLPALLSYIG